MPSSAGSRRSALSGRRPRGGGAGSPRGSAAWWRRVAGGSSFATRRRSTSRSRCERDEQPAVVVVRREEVPGHPLRLAPVRPQLEPLTHATDAPFECERRRVPIRREPAQAEALDDVAAEQILLREARELEHAATGRDDPSLLVADHEAGARRRVVVVHQLEEEAEATPLARDGHVVDLLQPVVVDRPLLAVRADEVRHALSVGSDPPLASEEPELGQRRTDDQRPGEGVAPPPVDLREVVLEVLPVEADDERGEKEERGDGGE